MPREARAGRKKSQGSTVGYDWLHNESLEKLNSVEYREIVSLGLQPRSTI